MLTQSEKPTPAGATAGTVSFATAAASGEPGPGGSQSIIDDAKNKIDPQSEAFLGLLEEQERIRANRLAGIRTVLVVLSSRAMPFDVESLKRQILFTYPDAAVFFRTTRGKPIGPATSGRVDLLIDFTGPKQRQWITAPRSLRKLARIAVGRKVGFFRGSYDRLFDEAQAIARGQPSIPADLYAREREVQRQVLALAGIAVSQKGETLPDLGKSIALGLPPMAKL
jgi:hypothetical protein